MCCNIFSSTLKSMGEHERKRVNIDENVHGAQVIRVGHEKVLLAFGEELVQHTRMEKCIVDVTVTGRVPMLLVLICTLGTGQEGLLEDAGVPRLVECRDANLLVGILLDDAQRVLVCVE